MSILQRGDDGCNVNLLSLPAASIMTAFVPCAVATSSFTALPLAKLSFRAVAVSPMPTRRSSLRASAGPSPSPQQNEKASEAKREETSFAYALFSMAVSASVALTASPALAEVPAGIQETFKTLPASLAHPGTMIALCGLALYTGYLGWQSRQIRTSDPETRKKLVKSKVTQRHFAISSLLMATMTVFTFEGMANTYTRTGKLFPGPHLYAGLGLVALMSVMASLVPYMQKGQNAAKNAHLAFGISAVGLFGWQANSGLAILSKLTHWFTWG
jgi:Protein of unknown function (DUF4079)